MSGGPSAKQPESNRRAAEGQPEDSRGATGGQPEDGPGGSRRAAGGAAGVQLRKADRSVSNRIEDRSILAGGQLEGNRRTLTFTRDSSATHSFFPVDPALP